MLKYLNDLAGLVYPKLCLACGRSLYRHEVMVCNLCWLALPRTHFHRDPENPVSRVFWGRARLEEAAACYYYLRGNRVQRLIHNLKYRGEEELGAFLGEKYGKEIAESGAFAGIDLIIPVPLHPAKLKKRGYNQSEAIARGLGRAMGRETVPDLLYRCRATETQTRKTRYNRWENVNNLFDVKDVESFRGKHLLLVDDVVTTGATAEACVHALEKSGDVRVSLLALAFSSR
ncbi:MAG TPA: ComF family protein [Bacteroidales bacterium]|nr:ComF family protein [Bacteroidales bacterium]HSA42160.1 ComF family protein [Bacteroidales bacterium]